MDKDCVEVSQAAPGSSTRLTWNEYMKNYRVLNYDKVREIEMRSYEKRRGDKILCEACNLMICEISKKAHEASKRHLNAIGIQVERKQLKKTDNRKKYQAAKKAAIAAKQVSG